jgi:2,4-dienoyl-CoA reductase (NADPH2)
LSIDDKIEPLDSAVEAVGRSVELTSFSHLLSPISIGGLALRNRVAMAPMGVDIVETDGMVREPTLAYYEERARGGVGLLITENTAAAYPRGANSANEIGVSDDKFLPGLSALTNRVHEFGAKIAVQLAHHGKVGRLDTAQGRALLVPSIPRSHLGLTGPLDLSQEEIALMMKAAGGTAPRFHEAEQADLAVLVADFASAAERARRAGFDAIELHGAHGYIFSGFLSAAHNFREDEYGGPIENRARLLCDVLRACKASAGADFPIWCRIDATEFGVPGGIQPEDAVRAAELLEEAGADAIHVSAYANPLGAGFTDAPIVHREGALSEYAARVKARVSVPVIVAGRITPELGDRLIGKGQADLVAMGRPLLADPELVAKLERDRSDQVRPCIYCYVCVAQPFFDRKVRCSVNPVLAKEGEYAERLRGRATEPKRVLVIGGGPAGLEAASIAAMRGHDVTLIEKNTRLGGTLRFAALTYEPNERLLVWLDTRARELPIDLRLGLEATTEVIDEIAPDLIIAAIGAIREMCPIPGAELEHVWDGDDLRDLLMGGANSRSQGLSPFARFSIGIGRAAGITGRPRWLRRASRFYMPLGRNVTIIGGGLVGAELADFMVERGRNVTLIEEGPVLALEMAHPRRWRVLHELREAGVRIEANSRATKITRDAVRIETRFESESQVVDIPADSVLIASGLTPNPDPVQAYRATGIPVVEIGDVTGVGYIEGAIQEGFLAAIDL